MALCHELFELRAIFIWTKIIIKAIFNSYISLNHFNYYFLPRRLPIKGKRLAKVSRVTSDYKQDTVHACSQ